MTTAYGEISGWVALHFTDLVTFDQVLIGLLDRGYVCVVDRKRQRIKAEFGDDADPTEFEHAWSILSDLVAELGKGPDGKPAIVSVEKGRKLRHEAG